MVIKNAGKAKIKKNLGKAPTKETVDTPISECEAENPLECRFHGLQALEQQLSAVLPSLGYKIPFGIDKLQGGKGYEIHLDDKVDVEKTGVVDSLMIAFKKQGWNLTYNGKIEDAGHSFYLKKGKGKIEKPSDKDNADIVDSSKSPKDDKPLGEDFGDEDFNALLEEAELEEPTLKKNPFEGLDEDGLTDDDVKDFLAKNGLTEKTKAGDIPFPEVVANWKGLIEDGVAPNGSKIEEQDVGVLKGFYDAAGPDNEVAQMLWAKMVQKGMVDENDSGKGESRDLNLMDYIGNPKKLHEDLKDEVENISDFDALLEEADGGEKEADKDSPESTAEKSVAVAEDEMKSIVDAALDSLPGYTLVSSEPTGFGAVKLTMEQTPDDDESLTHSQIKLKLDEILKQQGYETGSIQTGKNGKDYLYVSPINGGATTTAKPATAAAEAQKTSPKEPVIETSSPLTIEVSDEVFKPLEHNDESFPSHLSQKMLEDAIYNGLSAGGHGGLHTTIVEIDGKKFVCKKGVGKKSNIIKNGFNADMAYRAGGVYAPDAKLYEYGDGVTYKLSEFIEGKRLIDVWKKADEAKRDSIRKELLKGYPLDALFSNYDVLGTSPEESQTVTITGVDGKPQKTHVAFDNIIIGNDGHAYRIDNDGAFAMTGTGGHKSSGGAAYTTPVNAENWDHWDERQWIDDFRTMRRNEKNLGIFDRYSTADIFYAAGNINLDNAVKSLPAPLQKALAKPLFEMKQMTYRAVNIALGGFKNNGSVSMALDASYEASKKGLREQCQLAISWNNSGFGEYKSHWGNYQPQPFGEKPPEPPQDPTQILNSKLKNEEYTGGKIGTIILNAAKTINHHGGVKQTDKDGNVLGNGTAMSKPDYDPNAAKIAEWEKVDREKLEELAKTDENAKTLLGLYDTIAYSKENGWKKPIGQIPSGLVIKAKLDGDFKSTTEKKFLEDMAGAIKEFQEKEKKYQKELVSYEKRKSAHKKKEEEKALAAGGSPYHNFHHFADALMEEGINTDGVAHKVKTNGIAPIENSMASQKTSSYASDAVKWKVREMMALGYSPEQILKMAEDNKLYNGSYYTSCITNQLLPNKENWDRDMNSQAMYLGMNMIKMENEKSDLYDKSAGVVFLNRNISEMPEGLTEKEQLIYNSPKETGWVGPHKDSAADCMQFEKNSWGGSKKQVYAVPFSRIVCCANNNTSTGGGYGFEGEQEYVGNLYQLPCWVYHPGNNLTWKNAIDKAKESTGMKGLLKKFATRLGLFNTLLTQKKI